MLLADFPLKNKPLLAVGANHITKPLFPGSAAPGAMLAPPLGLGQPGKHVAGAVNLDNPPAFGDDPHRNTAVVDDNGAGD